MKPFLKYLAESEKTYTWKIRVAQDLDDSDIDNIENALKAYDIQSISRPKSLPIQQNPLGFEKLGAVPVNSFEIVLKYPTNEQQLRQLIGTAIKTTPDRVFAATDALLTKYPQDYLRHTENTEKSPILNNNTLPNSGDKTLYGDDNIKMTLKSLDMKTDKQTFAGKAEPKANTLNDIPIGTKSPIGSVQNKIPDPRKIKR